MCTFCEYCETLVTFPKGSRLIFILGCPPFLS
uniref:RNA polymerase I n=1 Tax=Microviridae sp. ctC1P1 TaxID=2824988 RepID=A0A8S5V6E9_9VIRU|nr:MAG TPA: RNA polymerase I [Microviridae sp. ctC1P1]